MDHSAQLTLLMEIFPEVDVEIATNALLEASGDIEGAVQKLLARQSSKKRKRTVDIRAMFGAMPDIRIKNDTVSDEKKMTAVELTQWNALKDLHRPITLTLGDLKDLPLAIQTNFLDENEAECLLEEMMQEAKEWNKMKWVYSPHVSRLYALNDMVRHSRFYNTDKVLQFSPTMKAVKDKVDMAINRALETRERHPLESKESWHANIVLGNCYHGHQESLGAHSDALTDLGPRPTIASLTLGAERIFRIKRLATDELPSQTIATQFEFYRHELPPVKANMVKWHPKAKATRINLTYRMVRPEYINGSPDCHCGKPAVLRTVNRAGKAKVGEYFYICPGSVPASCSYFLWLKDRVFQDKRS
ncbi:hypothetical protein THRCLA_20523 [Thraustotheca clavata]|uniref:CUE domain-containing protein n=1 Tax=Thraustotheca clavata TaxID=74557 RepID=A0A1W0A6G8_9STRA|nr:hypothetical protein THRCLA_20523 [Thraustotheca clavata]